MASATSVAGVADFPLFALGWLFRKTRRHADACPRLAQRQTGRRIPRAFIHFGPRFKKGTRHKRYANRLDSSRIDILRQMAAQNPGNSFARYGLAMELIKAGQLEAAVDEFKSVIQNDAAYSAAYYHGGQTLEKLGRLDDARDLYRSGVGTARDAHARSELQAALDILGN